MDEILRELPHTILNWLNQKWKYPATKEEFEAYLQKKQPEKYKQIESQQKKQEEMSEEKQREILVRTLQDSEVGKMENELTLSNLFIKLRYPFLFQQQSLFDIFLMIIS
jgi:hypothetical protein